MESESHGKKLTYTEDKILVFNLYLKKVPRAVSESQVREYFTKFGNVLSVTINEKRLHYHGDFKRNFNTHRYGFVNFETAESATAALSCTQHIINNHRIKIKPADSWKQPNIAERLTEGLDSKSILMLNDDCLLHIFSFLSLKQQVMLSTLCDRFKSILEMIFRKKKALFVNSEENLTLMEIRQICHSVGRLIQEVHIDDSDVSSSNSRYLNLIVHSCRELRWVEMNFVRNQNTFYRRLSRTLKNLTKVELRECSITDNACFQLSKLSELEYLDVSGNCELTGKYLADFPKLTTLNLSNCYNIQSKPFFALCSRNRNLKSLNIRRCDRLNRENFIELASQEHLEDLVISTFYSTDELSSIADLTNLKELTIFSIRTPQDNLFEELAKKRGSSLVTLLMLGNTLNNPKKRFILQMKNIKKLGIVRDVGLDDGFLGLLSAMPELTSLNIAGCLSISNQGLKNLFLKPNKLEHVDISSCRSFDECTVDAIVEKMKEAKRTVPCTFYVGSTNIPPSIIESDKYKENSSLLKLSFKLCEYGVCFDMLYDDYDEDVEEEDEFFQNWMYDNILTDSDDGFDYDELANFYHDEHYLLF